VKGEGRVERRGRKGVGVGEEGEVGRGESGGGEKEECGRWKGRRRGRKQGRKAKATHRRESEGTIGLSCQKQRKSQTSCVAYS